MFLTSSIFLLGMLGVTLPIAIHYLARQRTRVLDWGAMQFLNQSISSATAKRNRLRDLLLLLLRILAIIAIILAFAQPIIPRFWASQPAVETVFILDTSLSTSAIKDNDTVFSRMKKQLLTEIKQLSDQSKIRVLLAGSQLNWTRPLAIRLSPGNRIALEQELRALKPESGESHLAEAVMQAFNLKRADSEPVRRDIIILHDGQRHAWAPENEQWKVIQKQLANDKRYRLRSLSVVTDTIDKPQLVVTSLTPMQDIIPADTTLRVSATLRNTSKTQLAQGEVVWRINDREVARQKQISVEADTDFAIEEVLRFESTGHQQVTCAFESNMDVLPADNLASCIVWVSDPLPILIIDDTKRTQQGQLLPSEFLLASLGYDFRATSESESKNDFSRENSIYAPRVIRSKQLKKSMLSRQRSVIIAAADMLSDRAIQQLGDFVRHGGGLWFMLNSQQNVLKNWESKLLKELDLEPLTDTSPLSAEDPFQLKSPDNEFTTGTVARNMDLYRAELKTIRKFNRPVYLPEETRLASTGKTPWLLSMRIGEGRLLLQTSDLNRSNTNFPVLQAFVPIVRESTWEIAATSLPDHNLDSGQLIRYRLANHEDWQEAASTQNAAIEPIRLSLAKPDESEETVFAKGGIIESQQSQPGLYKLYDSMRQDEEAPLALFSLPRPVQESNLDQLAPEVISKLIAPAHDVRPAAQSSDLKDSEWPLAYWLAILAGLLFLAEALLARSIAQSRAKSARRIDLKPII